MLVKFIILGICLIGSVTFSYQEDEVVLGKLQTGAKFSFARNSASDWGIKISGGSTPEIIQIKPAEIQVFQSEDNIIELAAGYKSVNRSGSSINAAADIAYNKNVVFHINDTWTFNENVVTLQRKVEVEGEAGGGFNSSIVFPVDPSVRWFDLNCMAPGALYGDPTYNGDRPAGGTLNYMARQFLMREDMLPAPLFAFAFRNGSSIAMLNPSPSGESTVEETKFIKDVMTDARFQFGTFKIWQTDEDPVEFGYQFPGTTRVYESNPNTPAQPRWVRRFHPIVRGFVHKYSINFRFANIESFQNLIRDTWRWTWNTLKPAVTPIEVELVRRVLLDHLATQAATIDGRTAIPFAVATYDTATPQWNWTMAALGFVSKNIECADQFLREGDRDTSERGTRMREKGLSIISSMIQALSTVPLQATGYNLATGKPWDHIWLAPWLRNATEDMRVLIKAYRRERDLGRQHSEWFNWVKLYVDWLILQQRENGSFPRRWKSGSNEIAELTGSASYCPVPLLVMMSEETNDPKYIQAAIRAAEYHWANWGARNLFVGGTSDNPNITDKEAGMLSMEAYLSLYESTKESKWLDRAKIAADFTETWIWLWNLPMPIDGNDEELHWKKGVPTIGVQGITTRGAGGVDQYLDWSVSSYAKLFNLTRDSHYLDVARLLLHNTKAMVALPGRQYDMRGIGWQQEGWRMGPGGPGRGMSGHHFWLPWISANHLYSITGLEEYDKDLFLLLKKGN